MLEHDFRWTVDRTESSIGSTFTAINIPFPPTDSVLYLNASTLATTQSFAFQTALDSTGPWITENSTAINSNGTSNSAARIRVTGPYPWMRPLLNTASTGTYIFRLVAVR
jgi:hypothetical protein